MCYNIEKPLKIWWFFFCKVLPDVVFFPPRCVQGHLGWLGLFTSSTSTGISDRLVCDGLMLTQHFHHAVQPSSVRPCSGLCYHAEACRPDADGSISDGKRLKPGDEMQGASCSDRLSLAPGPAVWRTPAWTGWLSPAEGGTPDSVEDGLSPYPSTEHTSRHSCILYIFCSSVKGVLAAPEWNICAHPHGCFSLSALICSRLKWVTSARPVAIHGVLIPRGWCLLWSFILSNNDITFTKPASRSEASCTFLSRSGATVCLVLADPTPTHLNRHSLKSNTITSLSCDNCEFHRPR